MDINVNETHGRPLPNALRKIHKLRQRIRNHPIPDLRVINGISKRFTRSECAPQETFAAKYAVFSDIEYLLLVASYRIKRVIIAEFNISEPVASCKTGGVATT